MENVANTYANSGLNKDLSWTITGYNLDRWIGISGALFYLIAAVYQQLFSPTLLDSEGDPLRFLAMRVGLFIPAAAGFLVGFLLHQKRPAQAEAILLLASAAAVILWFTSLNYAWFFAPLTAVSVLCAARLSKIKGASILYYAGGMIVALFYLVGLFVYMNLSYLILAIAPGVLLAREAVRRAPADSPIRLTINRFGTILLLIAIVGTMLGLLR